MTENDLLKMLIEAYELGIEHGEERVLTEEKRCDQWFRLKEDLKNVYRELTDLTND